MTLPDIVQVLAHPVLRTAITRLRICRRGYGAAQLLETIGSFLALEATREIETANFPVVARTGVDVMGCKLAESGALVPIMRTGNGLLMPFWRYLPDARVYHVLARRDEKTAVGRIIDSKVPEPLPKDVRTVFILDPMLATGGSAEIVIKDVMRCNPERVVFASVFAAPEGVERLAETFPQMRILIAQMDERLNNDKFIIPGAGDLGDLLYGTT